MLEAGIILIDCFAKMHGTEGTSSSAHLTKNLRGTACSLMFKLVFFRVN